MVAETILLPDEAAIRADLAYMTRRWGELGQEAKFETRAFREGAQPQTALFRPEWIDDAVSWVANLNELGFNVYALRNPIRADVVKSAKDENIIASFFLWADADEPAAASNVHRFDGPKWSAAVTTGKTPSVRAHTYWELAEPCFDLAEWRRMQETIAAHFGTDRTVVNPSRIMRIGGTVSHPARHKRERGYVSELTTIRTEYDDARPPVTMDQMRRVFGSAKPAPAGSHSTHIPLTPDTHLPGDRRSAADYAEVLRRARTDGEKHGGVRDLAASLAGSGVPQALCEAIVQASCPVWDANVENLIASAYQKYHRPHAERLEQQAIEQDDSPGFDTAPLSEAEMRAIAPRRWLYGRKIVRGYVSMLVAPPGVGKSSWTAAVALDMATGANTLHDEPHAAMRTWLYNLEDPRDETVRKIAAVVRYKSIPATALDNIVVGSGRDRSLIVAQEVERGVYIAAPDVPRVIDAIKAANIGLLIVDPAVRAHRLPENDNKAIDLMMDQFARIAHEADCGVLLVHHTRKGFVGGDMDGARGASSMIGAARAVFTMSTMTTDEAGNMDIPEAERRHFVRIDNAKANLSPPSASAEWIKLESQALDNGTDEYPDGDFVQVVTKWAPPDPWEGIGPHMAEIFQKLRRGFILEDGTATPYRPDVRSDMWAGHVITLVMGDGAKTVDQCKAVISQWKEKGLIKIQKMRCPVSRKDREMIVVTEASDDE